MDETENNEIEEAVETSPEAAALEEMGLNEPDAESTDSIESTDKEELSEPIDPDKPSVPNDPVDPVAPVDPVKPEDDGKITDADLEPLAAGNKATQERFKKVTEDYKEERARADTLVAENTRYKESFDALRSLGFTDEAAAQDLVALSGYRHILATGDVDLFTKTISDQIREFESLHGKKVSIQASALDKFTDLKEKVDNLELDEETALELARSRSLQERATRDKSARQDMQVQKDTSQAQIDTAVTAIESMQSSWIKTDPDYKAILPYLQPQMADIGSNYPAHMWPSLIKMQYQTLKTALVSAAQPRQTHQPIRGNGRMSAQPAVTTPEQAALMEMGFDVD